MALRWRAQAGSECERKVWVQSQGVSVERECGRVQVSVFVRSVTPSMVPSASKHDRIDERNGGDVGPTKRE